VNEYTFSTMNSTATLTFSAVRDPEEIGDAVRSVFQQYDRRVLRDSLATDFMSMERGNLGLELAKAVHVAPGPLNSAGRSHPRTAALGGTEFHSDAARAASTMMAMALNSAGGFLDAAGVENWALTLNGDMLVAGERAVNEPWEVLIEDGSGAPEPHAAVKLVTPRRASKTLRVIDAAPNEHDLVQVTVVADDILTADLAAQDVLSGGLEQFSQFASKWNVDALAVDQSGSVHMTLGAFEVVSAGRND
jgi:thiamine biosynthesis lipoprotein